MSRESDEEPLRLGGFNTRTLSRMAEARRIVGAGGTVRT